MDPTSRDRHHDAARWWVLALASVASLMVALDILVVTTALSTIRVELGATVEQLEWTVNAYNLTFAVLLMTASAVGDRFGRRRTFAVGIAVFTAGSVAAALAPGVAWLVAARALQGVGAAAVMPVGLTLVSAAFPGDRRGRALGILSGVTGLATLGGPVVGGVVTSAVGWEWIFWLNVPIGLAVLPLVTRFGESVGPRTRLDVVGLVLVTGAALGLVGGLVRVAGAGWSAGVLALLTAGTVLAAAFVAWERRTPTPMLPMRHFRIRAFTAGNVAALFHSGVVLGAVFWMAQFLQNGLGYGPLEAGLRVLPWTGTMPVVAPLAGALADRFGNRVVVIGGLLLQGTGMAWLGLLAHPGVAYAALVPALLVSGIGGAAVFPAVQNAVVGAVGPDAVGQAAGAHSMIREFGGMLGIAVLSAAFSTVGAYVSPRAFTDGFVLVALVAAALALAGAVAGGFVRAGGTDQGAKKSMSPSSSPSRSRAAASRSE